MTKFTKGPWILTGEHGTRYVEARLRGTTLQEVAAVGPTETPSEQAANAALIAAAPELYEALEYTLNCLKQTDVGSAHWEPATAALAKAGAK